METDEGCKSDRVILLREGTPRPAPPILGALKLSAPELLGGIWGWVGFFIAIYWPPSLS